MQKQECHNYFVCGMCGFDNLVKGSDLDYHILKEFVPLKRYMYNKLNEVFFS